MSTDAPSIEDAHASLHDLQTKALATAQRFVDYDGYEQSETRAAAALAGRCPAWAKDDCGAWFQRALLVHRAGIEYIDAHAPRACELYKNHEPLDEIAGGFVAAHEGFPRDLLMGVLGWCVFWYHMK